MTTPTEQIQAQPAGKDVKQILAELSEKFPLCFSQSGEAKPLKIGIFQDLAQRLSDEDGISKTQIRHALRLYTSSWRYLAGVKVGVARVDLDGQAGELIDEQQAAHAAQTLEQSKAKAAELRKAKAAAERAKHKEQPKEQSKTAPSDKPAYKKSQPNKSAVAAKAARLNSKPQITEKVVQEQAVELIALNTATLKVGSAVQLKVGLKPVPATVLEVVKNDVVVQLASGMVIKTQGDKLFQA
ncbi:RNA chaperone ProQ [Rheinheimera mesophila]|uniref:RNA chaperone ProQ n=1 Tax=Rheinheimera mesophila TaxID=1547515 RepID=A0A3P3QMY8_9GAMM|nr:RNA chaperone ProQ [Rheinheimera mesophila]KKL00224.1 prop expression regulator [Rheinheimera mesophila]RRJ22612.1 RNA chaperone ProQ [Rheinheimera mesophila]